MQEGQFVERRSGQDRRSGNDRRQGGDRRAVGHRPDGSAAAESKGGSSRPYCFRAFVDRRGGIDRRSAEEGQWAWDGGLEPTWRDVLDVVEADAATGGCDAPPAADAAITGAARRGAASTR